MSQPTTTKTTAMVEWTLRVSRLVWDCVVSPGWLDHPTFKRDDKGVFPTAVALFGAAEAMFPLVGLVCTRVLSMRDRDGYQFRSYDAIASAAAVPSASCVAWLIEHRSRFRVLCSTPVSVAISNAYVSHVSGCILNNGSTVPGLSSPSAVYVSAGGAGRSEEVIIKEMTAVSIGLCAGGHVKLARGMVGDGTEISYGAGTLPLLWNGRLVKGWSLFCDAGCGVEGSGASKLLREKLGDHIKSSDAPLRFMLNACGSVNLDAVKWLLSALHIGRDEVPWVLNTPLQFALYHGEIGAIKWVFEEFHLLDSLPEFALTELVEQCAIGKCPGNIKWCEESLQMPIDMYQVLIELAGNKHSTLEDCKWLEDEIMEGGVPIKILQQAKKVEFVKWALSVSPEEPTEEAFNDSCKHLGDVSLAEWLVNERHCIPTPATFASACSTSKRNGSALAKWVSTKVTLTQPDILASLVQALIWNNTEVADWLEETFHVMSTVSSMPPEDAGSMVIEVCKDPGDCTDEVDGLKWFFTHLAKHISPSLKIDKGSIHDGVSEALERYSINYAVLLLDTFPEFDPQEDPRVFELLFSSFMKKPHLRERFVSSFGSSSLLTSDFVAKCLSSPYFEPLSSKAVKWVICKFNLQYTHIKFHQNALLLKLLCSGKNRCAEWLLNHFDIPLTDVVKIAKRLTQPEELDEMGHIELAGWKVLLRKYATGIDAALIQHHLMPIVAQSPHIALFTIREFGITMEQVREYYNTLPEENALLSQTELNIWLSMLDVE